MYLSATAAQVQRQFFAAIDRFKHLPVFNGWQFLEGAVEEYFWRLRIWTEFGQCGILGGHSRSAREPGGPVD